VAETNSAAEMVAFLLLEKIAGTENWGATNSSPHWRAQGVDRGKILDTYADCLSAARGSRKTGKVTTGSFSS
jgi:hypothetical protein